MTTETEFELDVAPENLGDPWDSAEGSLLRSQRNAALAFSDVLLLADHPANLDAGLRAEAWLYRRALRELTSRFASPDEAALPAIPAALARWLPAQEEAL